MSKFYVVDRDDFGVSNIYSPDDDLQIIREGTHIEKLEILADRTISTEIPLEEITHLEFIFPGWENIRVAYQTLVNYVVRTKRGIFDTFSYAQFTEEDLAVLQSGLYPQNQDFLIYPTYIVEKTNKEIINPKTIFFRLAANVYSPYYKTIERFPGIVKGKELTQVVAETFEGPFLNETHNCDVFFTGIKPTNFYLEIGE